MCSWVYTGSIIAEEFEIFDEYRPLKMYIFGWRNWSEDEDLNRGEFAMKLIFLMKKLKMRNSVCPEEKQSKDFEAWRFILSVLSSSLLSHINTVLLKGVKVTHWNEFPHDAQPKPNPTKSLKWGIWETWGLSQLRVLTITASHATSLILSTPTVILFKGIHVKSCRDAPRL